jgi:hypothetical protein
MIVRLYQRSFAEGSGVLNCFSCWTDACFARGRRLEPQRGWQLRLFLGGPLRCRARWALGMSRGAGGEGRGDGRLGMEEEMQASGFSRAQAPSCTWPRLARAKCGSGSRHSFETPEFLEILRS